MPDQLPSDVESQKQKKSHSITSSGGFKIGILVILILLLLIPVVMIRSLITERTYRANNAEESIMEAWGSEFTLYDPVEVAEKAPFIFPYALHKIVLYKCYILF